MTRAPGQRFRFAPTAAGQRARAALLLCSLGLLATLTAHPVRGQLQNFPRAMRPAVEYQAPSVVRPITFTAPSAAPPGTVALDAYRGEAAGAQAASFTASSGLTAMPLGAETVTAEGPVYDGGVGDGSFYGDPAYGQPWQVQWFPNGLVYRSYLAGTKEPRFGVQIFHEKDDGWLWDVTLGGRVGLLRYGTANVACPEGFQIDMEGAAFPRLDPEEEMDLNAADFRFGIPFTYGVGPWQMKFAYYHISSHLGDEYVLRNGLTSRFNYARDALVLGGSYFATPAVRLYAEADWAFYQDVAEPWAFQLGVEYSPPGPTGPRGAPFAAVNGHLRQELDYSGNVVFQAGWQWRSPSGRLMRLGAHYYNGLNAQFALYNDFEEQIGAGLWYDY